MSTTSIAHEPVGQYRRWAIERCSPRISDGSAPTRSIPQGPDLFRCITLRPGSRGQPNTTIYKGSDDLRALFFACDPRTTRGSGRLCCGCGLATKPGIGHFPGQSRLFSLFGLRVGAAPGLAKSTTFARRFTVNRGDRPTIERYRRHPRARTIGTFTLPFAL